MWQHMMFPVLVVLSLLAVTVVSVLISNRLAVREEQTRQEAP